MRLIDRLCRTREFCRGHGGDAYYASLLLRNAISHRELAQKPSVGVETHNMRLFERRCSRGDAGQKAVLQGTMRRRILCVSTATRCHITESPARKPPVGVETHNMRLIRRRWRKGIVCNGREGDAYYASLRLRNAIKFAHSLIVIFICVPFGNIVFDVIAYTVHLIHIAYDVVIISWLPSKVHCIGLGKRRHNRFITANH